MRIAEAIIFINPAAKFNISGHDIDDCIIEWLDGTTPISKADIKVIINQFAYRTKRKKEYPIIEDQLDMQYWDKINATSIWSDLITKIKSDNPKE